MRTKGKITNCPHTNESVYGYGRCRSCYLKWKYANIEEYRERKKELGREGAKKWMDKKRKEDPEFNSKRQKKFRKDHPDSFNMLMARFYWKKLASKQKQELIRKFP